MKTENNQYYYSINYLLKKVSLLEREVIIELLKDKVGASKLKRHRYMKVNAKKIATMTLQESLEYEYVFNLKHPKELLTDYTESNNSILEKIGLEKN